MADYYLYRVFDTKWKLSYMLMRTAKADKWFYPADEAESDKFLSDVAPSFIAIGAGAWPMSQAIEDRLTNMRYTVERIDLNGNVLEIVIDYNHWPDEPIGGGGCVMVVGAIVLAVMSYLVF